MGAFFAYSSQDSELMSQINSAITEINHANLIDIVSWESLNINGNFIPEKIFETIDSHELFICDLSLLNYNVLFELGYAIAKKKKIWIVLSENIGNGKSLYGYLPISSIGYSSYKDAYHLRDLFFSELPHESQTNIHSYESSLEKNIIYLKCDRNDPPTHKVTQILEKSGVPLKIEDPYEDNQLLNWFLEFIPNSYGIVIHFNFKNTTEFNSIDARKSFIAGLAYGFNIKSLLLSYEDSQNAPMDYKALIQTPKNISHCEEIVREWLSPVQEGFKKNSEIYTEYEKDKKALSALSNLILGDHIAENEQIDLIDYFIETSEYNEALTSQQILFVGRKGTGKTANLIKLTDTFNHDKRNFVIVIQPFGHEFEGILQIMKKLISSSEKGHLIENIWKYLIYTEISKQYFDFLENQPHHYAFTEDENNFIEYYKNNYKFINADFTLRLENILTIIFEKGTSTSLEDTRSKISEILHESIITNLRLHLGKILNKKEKVVVLIDNLDKTWSDNEDLEQLSLLLFGLLNVTHKISDDFKKQNYKHNSVNLALIVFLRSDIFNRVLSFAPEQDKIPFKHLSWNDSSQLFRVIENRIEYSSQSIASPDELWKQYFCKNVNGIDLKKYVQQLILPRPRDIVFLFKAAIQEAINRGHTTVEEFDFLEAEYLYSQYALQSILPENGGRIENFESILYDFAGETSILTKAELEKCLVNVKSKTIEETIEILCELTFLGKEIRENEFEFYSERRNKAIINKLAVKYSERSTIERYMINNAFHKYLEIDKVNILVSN
ncbi:P-loop ATPase, Sll1717 family [Lysinibacillus sp. S2017]|uniref:P-loop ATPase, Sll1717 family n=1 Tax=Lysinibacillus sp. S2017 TaxID=2561923 RepID=UPI001F0CE1AE|nr:hypothetical protein [Lysinibacillus sp. S2017]